MQLLGYSVFKRSFKISESFLLSIAEYCLNQKRYFLIYLLAIISSPFIDFKRSILGIRAIGNPLENSRKMEIVER